MFRTTQIFVNRLPKFWRNVGVVTLGTILAQAIPFLTLLYFARVLPADVLGAYFLWFSIASVVATVVSLCLEQAIFVARDRTEVDSLVRTIVIVAGGLSVMTYGVALVANRLLPATLLDPIVRKYIWGWGAFPFFYAVSQALIAVYIYRSDFINSSVVRFALAFSVGIVQLGAVAAGLALDGLVYGQVIAYGSATLLMMWRLQAWPFNISSTQHDGVAAIFRRHYRFVVFSTPTVMLNAAAAQMPFLIMSAKYGNEIIAFFGLAQRLLIVPSGLLGVSILTVFKDEAGAEIRSTGACSNAYRHALKSLLWVSVLPYLALFLFVKPVFILAFGPEWSEAGVIAQYLTPMLFVGFVAGPLSYTLTLTHRQSWFLITQSCLFIVTLLAFGLADSVRAAIIWYSAGRIALYLIEIGLSYVAAKGTDVIPVLAGDSTNVTLSNTRSNELSHSITASQMKPKHSETGA